MCVRLWVCLRQKEGNRTRKIEKTRRVRLCEKKTNSKINPVSVWSMLCGKPKIDKQPTVYTLIIESVRNSKVTWIENTPNLMICKNHNFITHWTDNKEWNAIENKPIHCCCCCFFYDMLAAKSKTFESHVNEIQVRSIYVPAVITCTDTHSLTHTDTPRNVCMHSTFTTPSLTSFYQFILYIFAFRSYVCAVRASCCHQYTNFACECTPQ